MQALSMPRWVWTLAELRDLRFFALEITSIMNRIIFYAALLCCTGAFGQSKKELAALLKERTAEVEQLKAKVAELEKPKDVSLTDERKRISYGLGVLMASNVRNQGADSLDTEALGIAFRDVFE